MGGKVMLLLLVVMIVCGGCECKGGKVYKVGGSSGWTNIGPLPYKSWPSSIVFHVGDTLLFEYNKEFHNVVRVTHTNFNNCNSTNPYHTWSTGNDSFTIPRHGHFYFICGVPGHCQSGQKIDIRVPKSVPAPSPQSPSIPGPNSVSVAPAPSPKSGSSSLHLSWQLWVLVVAIGLPHILS
ncbi:hypothetical protein ACP275_09G058200 [Erythranthe tilingii]